MISRSCVGLLLCLFAAIDAHGATYLSGFDLDSDSAQQWKLSDRLREISGLQLTPEGYLLAHDDERAAVYVLDYRAGSRIKTFRLGEPTVHADFEGVAMADAHVYLIESLGRLYEAPLGEDGAHVMYNTYDTGVGARCEVEGLTFVPEQRTLAIACKEARAPIPIAIYFWSLDQRRLLEHSVPIPVEALTAAIGTQRFRPSGVDWDARSGHFIVIAAHENAIAEIDADGRLIAVRRLSGRLHRQAEGIAIIPGGPLILADEGGKKRARLTVYAPSS